MGTTVNGMPGMGAQPVMTGSVVTGSSRSSYAAHTRKRTGSTGKKKLDYNYREISGQLIQARKSQSAAIVLTRAKGKLALLMRKAGTGQYDQRAVSNAVTHARRMVRCAQMKMRNLKSEEEEKRMHENEHGGDGRRTQSEAKRRAAGKERHLEAKIAQKELQQMARVKRERGEMMRKRRQHRSQEISKIMEADMKYVKGEIERSQSAGSSTVRPEAVLDLSAEAAAIAELQRLEQERQMAEQEIEAEAAAETAMDGGDVTALSGMPAEQAMSMEAAPAADVAVNVDAAV